MSFLECCHLVKFCTQQLAGMVILLYYPYKMATAIIGVIFTTCIEMFLRKLR